MALSWTMDKLGPLCRAVEDCAIVLSAIHGPDGKDRTVKNVAFNWDGGVPDHIGIVEKSLGGGQFQTVEGNTAVGNDSNGGEVMRRVRYLSQVDGFGRVR